MKERNSGGVEYLINLSKARESSVAKKTDLVSQARAVNQENYDKGWEKAAERRIEEVELKNQDTPPVEVKEGFFSKHKKEISRVAASVLITTGAGVAVDTVISPNQVFASSAVVETQPGGEAPSQQAYNQMVKDGVIVADADVNLYPEATATPEKVVAKSDTKMILELNKNYYLQSNSLIPGENNILKKSDTCPITINGRTMVPVRMISEALGATVGWEGKTQTVTVTRDSLKVTLKLGSNIMILDNGDGNSKQITLDTAAQTDKSGRTIVPVRAISEALGVEVQWSGANNSVGIGYTKAEWTTLFGDGKNTAEYPARTIDLESTYKAFQYMAGGQYTDCLKSGVWAMKDAKTGAVVVYADGRKTIDQKDLTNLGLKANDCVYVMNGNKYLFREGKLNKCLRSDGKSETITFPDTRYQHPALQWDKKLGIVAVDQSTDRVIRKYVYNTTTKKHELKDLYPNFILLGSPEQRIKSSLEKMLNTVAAVPDDKREQYKNVDRSNPLRLNKNEVSQYLKTFDDKDCESFKVINYVDKDGKERPGFVFVRGGQFGMDEKYADLFMQEMDRLNLIDPEIIRKMVTVDGVAVATKDILIDEKFAVGSRTEGFQGTFDFYDFGGTIFINPVIFEGERLEWVKIAHGTTMIIESEGLNALYYTEYGGNETKLPDALDHDVRVHKAMYLRDLAKKEWPKGVISVEEYNDWFISAEANIMIYIPDYQRQWKRPER